jgi:acyl-CoA dehydrogenase
MPYRAPVADMAFTMRHVAGLGGPEASALYPDLTEDLLEAILDEAGKFASERIAPLNKVGDTVGATLVDGHVTTAPGWKEAYRDWCAAGWNALPGPESHGGQGLPTLLNAACIEMWNAASMAFGIGPVLSMGAVEALVAHGSDALKERYLAKVVSGEWTGTMNLTEPQAGSDLAALRTRAEPVGDGTYRITGQKIYITYGEHDLTDNIVHLVLARLPDAPPGTRGISLFLVPKVLVNDDGTLGARNDVHCSGLEHKLGIHGSPTCTMVFGDHGGAVGWLVGEENRGLACMFTMMNNARLAVALQGVAIAERSTQKAVRFANERKQGRAPGSDGDSLIVEHPDVKRMLMEMRAKTAAARAICYRLAAELDRAHRAVDEAERQAAHARASLLTPVAKAFSTDIGTEVASLGVQVHGGMGYVEETGAAQHYRDARIAQIYEGTNGIQAIDLVTRKVPLQGGAVVAAEIAAFRETIQELRRRNDPAFGRMAQRLGEAVDSLDHATAFMLNAVKAAPADALAGATPYLRLYALAAGGIYLGREALAAASDLDGAHRVRRARFFAENLASAASGLETSIIEGAESVTDADFRQAS